jgi:hypothetical protein
LLLTPHGDVENTHLIRLLLGTRYRGAADIDFDLVSFQTSHNESSRPFEVSATSSEHTARIDDDYHPTSRKVCHQPETVAQEPMKLGDAAEDHLRPCETRKVLPIEAALG